MATAAQTISNSSWRSGWFLEFLNEELTPYPGRGTLVARMVVASTIVMILTMTFQIPYGAYGAAFALTISRENPKATVNAATTNTIAFACSELYVLLGTMLFLYNPTLRLFWVIGTLFLMFYGLRVLSNYTAAARFGYLLIVTIPLWDEHTPATNRVEYTLWAFAAIGLGSLVTVLTELVFAELWPDDSLIQGISRALAAIERMLIGYADNGQADDQTHKEITRLALLGTSRLRRDLHRSGYTPLYAEQMGAVTVLVGRLVDIAANLTHLAPHISQENRRHIRYLAENIAAIRANLVSGKVLRLIHHEADTVASLDLPLFAEMAKTVSLITEAFSGSTSLNAYAAPSSGGGDPERAFFVRDAFSNPEHIKFALRGCLATSLCYIFYNAKDWPGISTAITTCFLTALTTVGGSHQKQILRIAGAFIGGLVLGLGAQVFVLPYLDSIAGFTLVFLAVTILASWIATSGPRLSYLGIQIAVAFYLVNLSEFKAQTSLYPGRDRVLGIFLGLLMMYVAFDLLGGASSIVEMKKQFVSNLHFLAKFTREPVSEIQSVAVKQAYSLREKINKTFDEVREAGDGVALEFGDSRQQDLAWRARIKQWQPQLRTLFLLRIALWKFRARLDGFELPDGVLFAQEEFDNQAAGMLDNIADRLEGKAPSQPADLHKLFGRLQRVTNESNVGQSQALSSRLQTFLLLAQRTESLMISLENAITPDA